jgi:hypothetical protein
MNTLPIVLLDQTRNPLDGFSLNGSRAGSREGRPGHQPCQRLQKKFTP